MSSHKHSASLVQNQKAHLANAYNELGKELSSSKIKVIGNYTLGKVIGEGAYGKVRMGTHRLTATRVAVKQIPKAMSSTLTREIHHHRTLHHPHVAQMYEVIATENSIWIITELCSGGELFDYLVEKGRLSEEETRILIGQLCLAVAYLHDKGIVHRDLKMENVLLDERCRVKLSDYGFTREFERGSLMETFCGTTGYAAPEMLEGRKYQGPEVDVWSLGVILYCLLTGTLPFDDDNEDIMQKKIIQGHFEDPEWLSDDARDLIKGILVKDTSSRLTIPQILAHNWFKPPAPFRFATPPPVLPPIQSEPPPRISEESSIESQSPSSTQVLNSVPTTPEDDPFDPAYVPEKLRLLANESQSTLGKRQSLPHSDIEQPETVLEEEEAVEARPAALRQRTDSNQSRAPPISTVRTPARTKRRSVSSTLSDDNATEKALTIPSPRSQDNVDFSDLLSSASPIIFSTPLERQLLNSLSLLGFDLGQIVYSVMNDACDSASALWWIMLRRAEKKLLDGDVDAVTSPSAGELSFDIPDQTKKQTKTARHGVGVQTEPHAGSAHVSTPPALDFLRAPPELGIVPPTPTASSVRPNTPPTRAMSPGGKTPLLTPSSSMRAVSNPATPSGSTGKGRAKRAGSVSIMQRATTALEAAGLVRKKSSEAVREQIEKDKPKAKDKDGEKSSKSAKSSVGDESRSSHGSGGGPSRLTKSPPPRTPTTPPPSDATVAELHAQVIGSPWVLAERTEASSSLAGGKIKPSPAQTSPGIPASQSQPLPSTPGAKAADGAGNNRNRGNFLNQFRLWLNEDRKGKRKDNTGSPNMRYNKQTNAGHPYTTATMKRRTSSNGPAQRGRGGRRAHRPSVSSRRSSSVNSRRSSVTSIQMVLVDSPSAVGGRRSMGAHTPNSDRGGELTSRPSSVRSFSMQRHGKSPSASSLDFRAASPNQRYHRRAGSGSSTRVVRQMQPPRPGHHRSNSATSSIHSPVSSRPPSFIEQSESEGARTTSPFRARRHTDASDGSGSSRRQAYFVAQKKQVPFASPMQSYGSMGRSSWKKSWGLEPPGWRTRSTQLPVEVLVVSPVAEGGPPRDVFAGRQSLSLGDESDWVDEDDDAPYAVGLGQGLSVSKSSSPPQVEPINFAPAPKDHSRGKRGKSGSSGRGKASQHSPATSHAPLPTENLFEGPNRRQLPTSRAGPAFRHPIQEEDEDEEE